MLLLRAEGVVDEGLSMMVARYHRNSMKGMAGSRPRCASKKTGFLAIAVAASITAHGLGLRRLYIRSGCSQIRRN